MTDIVERLRELYKFAAQQKSRDWDEQDEIRDLFKYTFDTTYEAADEIERLREALRDLVIAVEYNGPPIDFGDGNLCWEARIPIAFIDQARAALGEKE